MYRNRWTYATSNAIVCLVINLTTRAIWWSDEPLLSWNIPLSLAAGFLAGLALWPVIAWWNRKFQEKQAALQKAHDEAMELIRLERYSEAMGMIDDFLANPKTGVRRGRPKRRSPEARLYDELKGGM